MAYLLVTANGRQFWRCELTRTTTLGRSLQCELFLADSRLSRRHCRLEFAQGQWFIVDLGSRNGTYVRSERVFRRALRDGDAIRIGQQLLYFHSPAQAAPPAPSGPSQSETPCSLLQGDSADTVDLSQDSVDLPCPGGVIRPSSFLSLPTPGHLRPRSVWPPALVAISRPLGALGGWLLAKWR